MKRLDEDILLQLLEDAEQPVVDIADKVGASRQTVSKKIDQFKEEGIIENFKVKVNPDKLGLKVRAFVFLQEDPKDDMRKEIQEKINNFTQVTEFLRVFGRYSGILEVWTKDKEELTSLVKNIHNLEGVKETETFIVHDVIKSKAEDPLIEVLRE